MGLTNDGVLTYPFTKIAANGSGDLQRALGSSSTSHGALFALASIRVMAKYKPFKNSTAAFASDSARTTARIAAKYGMKLATNSQGNNYFAPNDVNNRYPLPWVYDRPVQETNPLRAMDFIKDTTSTTAGYDMNAVAPLAITMQSGLIRNSDSMVLIWMNGGVNTYWEDPSRSAPGHWVADRSLSVYELLHDGANVDYSNKYITFVIYDKATPSSNTIIVTNKKFGDLQEVNGFWLSANGRSADGCPAIPFLQTITVGRTYQVLVCLCDTGPSVSTNAYEIRTSNNLFSLAFDANYRTDMIELAAKSVSNIDLLSGTINSGFAIRKVSDVTISGVMWEKWEIYSLPMTATVVVQSGWPTSTSVQIITNINVPSGSATNPSSTVSPTRDVTITTTFSAGTQSKNIITSGNGYIYFPKVSGMTHIVSISAQFKTSDSSKHFDNSITLTD